MLSSDGVPLLIHDETLERTTGGQGRVCELTAKIIRSYDAGAHHHPAYAVSPTPTLAEAIACCQELGLWANIEIKPASGYESITGTTVGLWLAQHWNGCGVVSSFSSDALVAARHAGPMLPLASLFTRLPPDWREQTRRVGASAIHLGAEHVSVIEAEALGETPWACYTVNNPAEAKRLSAIGCRAIFTDRPDLWSSAEM